MRGTRRPRDRGEGWLWLPAGGGGWPRLSSGSAAALAAAVVCAAVALGAVPGCLVEFDYAGDASVAPDGDSGPGPDGDASVAPDGDSGPGPDGDASVAPDGDSNPCSGRQCGTWEGFDCGTCAGATEYCDGSGQCVDDCAGRVCGPSPVQSYDCGTCAGATEYCDGSGQCVADPAGLTWLPLSGGTYQMGSTTGGSDEQPVHPVTVPAFQMTQTEVTVQQYGACVTASSCTAPGTGANCNWNDPGYEDHPVNCVDWQQAVDFCTWEGGRLPTEAEWEYAGRSGGQAFEYPWGNDTATCTYAVMDDGGSGCGTGRTWSVCSKAAGNTSQRLCDMAGNVWEWVEDWYHSDYTGAPTDGSAWLSQSSSIRVARGGSFGSYAESLRAAARGHAVPSGTYDNIGFRCARVAP